MIQEQQRLLLVGCGSMGSALLTRLLSQPLFQAGIDIITPRKVSVEPFLNDHRVKWYPIPPQDLTSIPNVVLIAVKPHQLDQVLPQYKHLVNSDTLFLTVAAGKAVAFYQYHLGQDVRLVRAMPNTPVAIGCGQTIAYAVSSLTAVQKEQVSCLLNCFGDVYWLASEEKLNQATVLTGCGPAYVYRFIEGLSRAAQHLGIEQHEAMEMAQKMVIGATQYLDKNQQTPEQLRIQVTSPGGITAAALAVLDHENALDNLLTRALQHAYEKEQ